MCGFCAAVLMGRGSFAAVFPEFIARGPVGMSGWPDQGWKARGGAARKRSEDTARAGLERAGRECRDPRDG